MAGRTRGLVVLLGLLAWQAGTPTRGEDGFFEGRSGPAASEGVRQGVTPLPPTEPEMSAREPIARPRAADGGTVHGRLSNRGRPLVACHVVIVPMHEENGVSCFDPDRKPLDTLTDDQGEYRFEDVAPGAYKLTWLPQGQTRWIRRIAMTPDVKVRNGETTGLREIRVALQTVN
jgi:hypothetical protein